MSIKPPVSQDLRFLLIMLAAATCLGLVPVFEKQAVATGSGLFTLVIAINVVTVACLAAPAWRQRPRNLLQDWPAMLLIGAVASGVVVLLNLWALETTTATHRGVFQAMYPAATAVFAFLLLGERLPWKAYALIVLMFVGIITMSVRGMRLELAFGDLLLILTLPMMGLCDAWAKKSLGNLQAEWLAFARFAFGSLALLIILLAAFLINGTRLNWPAIEAWIWILLSGISIGLGIILLYRGMKLKGASLAAALVGLSPVLTLVVEWLFMGGRFTPIELMGMTLVISGGLLLSHPHFQKF
ncbi:MAG: DMT family transporter [Pseudohongiellaceae bacterium]